MNAMSDEMTPTPPLAPGPLLPVKRVAEMLARCEEINHIRLAYDHPFYPIPNHGGKHPCRFCSGDSERGHAPSCEWEGAQQYRALCASHEAQARRIEALEETLRKVDEQHLRSVNEHGDTLRALHDADDERGRLERDRDEWKDAHDTRLHAHGILVNELRAAEAEVARLRGALQTFFNSLNTQPANVRATCNGLWGAAIRPPEPDASPTLTPEQLRLVSRFAAAFVEVPPSPSVGPDPDPDHFDDEGARTDEDDGPPFGRIGTGRVEQARESEGRS